MADIKTMTVEITEVGNQFTAKNVSNRYNTTKKNVSSSSGTSTTPLGPPANQRLLGAPSFLDAPVQSRPWARRRTGKNFPGVENNSKKVPPLPREDPIKPSTGTIKQNNSVQPIISSNINPTIAPAIATVLPSKPTRRAPMLSKAPTNSLNALLLNPKNALKERQPPLTENQKRKLSLKTSIGRINQMKSMISDHIAHLNYEHNGTALATEDRLKKHVGKLETYRSQLDDFMKLPNTQYQSKDIEEVQKKVDDTIESIREKLASSGGYRRSNKRSHKRSDYKRSDYKRSDYKRSNKRSNKRSSHR